jgi:hypothetical protein
MAGQDEPGLVGARPIGDEQGNMLGRVSRRMEDVGGDVAQLEHVAVTNAAVRPSRFRFGEQYILGTGDFGQPPPCRDMVGVNMRVDDIENAHPGVSGRIKIWRDLAHRIDHGSRCLSATAEEIGDRDGIAVQELAQDHGHLRVSLDSPVARMRLRA